MNNYESYTIFLTCYHMSQANTHHIRNGFPLLINIDMECFPSDIILLVGDYR